MGWTGMLPSLAAKLAVAPWMEGCRAGTLGDDGEDFSPGRGRAFSGGNGDDAVVLRKFLDHGGNDLARLRGRGSDGGLGNQANLFVLERRGGDGGDRRSGRISRATADTMATAAAGFSPTAAFTTATATSCLSAAEALATRLAALAGSSSAVEPARALVASAEARRKNCGRNRKSGD